jgi:hypothetical protein
MQLGRAQRHVIRSGIGGMLTVIECVVIDAVTRRLACEIPHFAHRYALRACDGNHEELKPHNYPDGSFDNRCECFYDG